MASYQIYLKISGAALVMTLVFIALGLFFFIPWLYLAAAASLIISFATFAVYRKHRDENKEENK